ncbi:MAG TPA: hypothetical protein GXX34_01885 [Clostridia bacterium]|nr:hypothetical protein [Clostridia bacterium]
MEWVLKVLPLGGIGCCLVVLLAAVAWRRRLHRGETVPDLPPLILIFHDYVDGVEVLVRWLLWQRWWRDCSRPLLIGLEGRGNSSCAEMQAILWRLQRESQSFHLLPAAGIPEQPTGSGDLVLIGADTGVSWDTLKAMLENPAFASPMVRRNWDGGGK